MKYLKRAEIYKASNVTFDPKTISAFSYSWWKFVAVVDGYTVFNSYHYSPSTCKHQWKVRSLMRELGIKIDFELPIPGGLPGSYRRSYSHSQVTPEDASIEQLIQIAEEYLCDQFIGQIVKRQDQYYARKVKLAEHDDAFKRSLNQAIQQSFPETPKPALQSINGDAYMSRPSTAKLSLV